MECMKTTGLKSRDESKKYHVKKLFENHSQDINYWLENIVDAGYCDGYNTVLQAYEDLFGLDERYWKLVNYLDKNGY